MKCFLITFSILIFSFNLLGSTYEAAVMDKISEQMQKRFNYVPVIPTPLPTVTPNIQPIKEEVKNPNPLSGKEKVELMLKKNREKIKNQQMQKNEETVSGDWISQKTKQNQNWMNNRKDEINAFEKEKKELIAKWYEKRKQYLKEIPKYKKTLAPLLGSSDDAKKIIEKYQKKYFKPKEIAPEKNSIQSRSSYHLINGAIDSSVRDQKRRPTCSAFAGVRAMEIVLNQKGTKADLSEQYFYYASKPDCQNSPCSKRGSWAIHGLAKSKEAARADIPKESDCPYTPTTKQNNETQLPLSSGCSQGVFKVKNFYQVKDFSEILTALDQNHPVIGGIKLTDNFYDNEGLVLVEDIGKTKGKKDEHAEGHAVLFVGYMKLPPTIQNAEGDICLITANSWGEGWGQGGHSCLSQKWIDKNKYGLPYLVLTDMTSSL